METGREIIQRLRTAAPPGQARLDDTTLERLRELTRALVAASDAAVTEHRRFLGIRQRGLCMPEEALAAKLRGSTVLVTGGTGCIGSALMQELAQRTTGRLASLSRGVSAGWPRVAGADYLVGDVRDRRRLDEVIDEVRPDLIFHVAAQRNPGLAEVEVHRTVTTNILGTRNVLAAAAAAGIPQVVCASTGKALRPYSPEIYTATKRAAEWVTSCAAASGELACSAGRFTHVVDNSIIYQRLVDWANGDGVIRLHSADIAFYAQSALESAQLLLVSSLGWARGEFLVHAITDLGWPVSLLDLAVGVLAQAGSAVPIYVSGYDRGYEEVPFPGLYDPATAGGVSPLLNAFEAAASRDAPCTKVDTFRLEMTTDSRLGKQLAKLEEVCDKTEEPEAVRSALDELSWSLLDVTLRAAPGRALARAAAMADPHRAVLSREHAQILATIRAAADSAARIRRGG